VSPTNTPLPPTPTLEPVTLRAGGPGGAQATVEAHRPVIAEWGWAVCDPNVLQDNLGAITLEVVVDDQVVATGSLAEYRQDVREIERDGVHMWVADWAYPMGAFEAGSFHWLEVHWRLSRAVTDGCDYDGDGQLDVYGPGLSGVQRLEVTVR
jgi:hypothetical protein